VAVERSLGPFPVGKSTHTWKRLCIFHPIAKMAV
jgi:hypothetical protein